MRNFIITKNPTTRQTRGFTYTKDLRL